MKPLRPAKAGLFFLAYGQTTATGRNVSPVRLIHPTENRRPEFRARNWAVHYRSTGSIQSADLKLACDAL